MAKTTNDKGAPLFQRSPGQAYRIFGFDGDRFDGGKYALNAPRPQFLFLIRFVRGTTTNTPPKWETGLQFAVKRFDRPRISADMQSLNQYNKKRLVQTNIKFGAVKIEFHDTSDQMVMQMWHEYAAFYFGDFRKTTANDWDYDLTNTDFKNTGGTGFGLTLPNEEQTEATRNSPKGFFSKIECYQFSNGTYTQFDLINPKISSFDPDEMDYGSVHGHGITMTLEYETIIYNNDNVPVSMTDAKASDFIKSLLTDRNFVGDVYEPTSETRGATRSSNLPFETKSISNAFNNFSAVGNTINKNAGLTSAFSSITSALGSNTALLSKLPGNTSSVLSSFGNMNFGNAISSLTNGLSIPGVPTSTLNQVTSKIPGALNTLIGKVASNPGSSTGVSSSLYDIAKGQAQKISNGSSISSAFSSYSTSVLQDSAVGTIDLPDISDGDDYSDWA
jgi:hypothetical protein